MIAKVAYVMAIAAALVSGTQGMVMEDDDASSAARRALIKSRRGLQSSNDYIAQVLDGADTGASCASVTEAIDEWKNKNMYGSFSLRADGSQDVGATNVTITTCFVFFSGPAELATYVEGLDKVIEVEIDQVVINDATPASWGLDRIDQEDLPLSKSKLQISHTGIGVNIYVIDTGVNTAHSDFGGRAYLMKDFTSENGGDIEDGNGHGSHTSGTAAGSTYGIAREATIMGVKVLSSSGSGSTSGVINGINWAVSHQQEQYGGASAVLSMSLGGGRSTAMNNAVMEAAEAGMIVVVAAGNENQDACNVSPASAGGSARDGGVITVGATTRADAMASYSNYGECTDIFAPGSSITSAWKGGTTAYKTISGTSMATPHVAGVAAVLLEKHSGNKDLAQAELLSLAVPDKVTGLEGDSTNILLQVPQYTGPPTPPTASPTMPPTNLPNEVCIEDYCVDFEQSTFGGDFPKDTLITGPLVATENSLCTATDEDFSDSIVMVPRGDCLFFDKVKVAENQGAKAVIFRVTSKTDAIFAAAYYGSDSTSLVSVMIGYNSAATFDQFLAYNDGPTIIKLGSPSNDGTQAPTPFPTTAAPTPPTPKPTPAPTMAPTSFPTVSCGSLNGRKSRCKSMDYCVWDQSSKKCYDLSGDVPCSILDESACDDSETCAWALIPAESKKAACYDIDAVPDGVTNIETPSDCDKRKTFEEAEALCATIGATLCSGSDLIYSDIVNTCGFNSQWVWSGTSCGNNKYYQVKHSNGGLRCMKKNKSNGGTRCC